jgi:hypothetical protein
MLWSVWVGRSLPSPSPTGRFHVPWPGRSSTPDSLECLQSVIVVPATDLRAILCRVELLQVLHGQMVGGNRRKLYVRGFGSDATLYKFHLFPVPTNLSTTPVEQLIDLFLNRPAYTTLHVGITARPIAPLASLLFNRPQEDNYARKNRT